MEISYKRSRGASYMILHENQAQQGTGYQRQIFFENEIPGLLSCQVQRLNGEEYFYYNITGFQSIHNLFENRKYDSKDLKELFQAWNQCMEILEEYLLESDYLLLASTFIYRNQDTQSYGFVWFPFQISCLQAELRKLTEYLLPKIDHKDKRAVSLGYGIYKESTEANLSLEILKRQIYQEEIPEEGIDQWYQTEAEDKGAEWKTEGKGAESEEMWQKQAREKILDDFYKDEEEEEKPYGLWGTLGVMAGVGTAVFLNNHYRLIPVSWMLILLSLLVVLGGVGVILWFFVRKPRRSAKEQDNSEKAAAGGSPELELFQKSQYFMSRKQSKSPGSERTLKVEEGGLEADNRVNQGQKMKGKEEKWERPFGKLEPGIFSEAHQGACQENYYKEEQEKYIARHQRTHQESLRETCQKEHDEKYPVREKEVSQPGEAMTQVLSQESKFCSCLVGIGFNSGKIFPLEKETILVGKWKESVDICLDAPTVSRIHGKILHQERQDCLIDLNSKNGTAVNGDYLNPEEPYPLKDGDRIAFAREEFFYSGGSH